MRMMLSTDTELNDVDCTYKLDLSLKMINIFLEWYHDVAVPLCVVLRFHE